MSDSELLGPVEEIELEQFNIRVNSKIAEAFRLTVYAKHPRNAWGAQRRCLEDAIMLRVEKERTRTKHKQEVNQIMSRQIGMPTLLQSPLDIKYRKMCEYIRENNRVELDKWERPTAIIPRIFLIEAIKHT